MDRYTIIIFCIVFVTFAGVFSLLDFSGITSASVAEITPGGEFDLSNTFWYFAIGVFVLSLLSVLAYEKFLRVDLHPAFRDMNEIKKYFVDGIKKGHPINELKGALLKQNVPEHQIELALLELRKL
jgi:hypothetical protein